MFTPTQIEVRGVDGELKSVAEGTLSLKPNFAYTLKEVTLAEPFHSDVSVIDHCHGFTWRSMLAAASRCGKKPEGIRSLTVVPC